jgi:hypothetical protein
MVLESRIYELVEQHTVTMVAQLQAAARPEWLARQTASELAQLVREERDSLIRLLSGFRPVSDQPAAGGMETRAVGELGSGDPLESD